MERFAKKYQPIIKIQLIDDAFGTSRLSIVPQETTKDNIDNHPCIEKKAPATYSMGFITRKTAAHRSAVDKLNPDYSVIEREEHHIETVYDYQESNQEYSREVFLPVAEAATVTEDLDDHIFENSLLLRFFIKFNPLLKDSLLPEDNNLSRLVFADDILTPSTSVREKDIIITPVVDNENLKWQIEEEGKAMVEVTALDLEEDVLAECQVNIPAHLTNVHSISYTIHIKRSIIINP